MIWTYDTQPLNNLKRVLPIAHKLHPKPDAVRFLSKQLVSMWSGSKWGNSIIGVPQPSAKMHFHLNQADHFYERILMLIANFQPNIFRASNITWQELREQVATAPGPKNENLLGSFGDLLEILGNPLEIAWKSFRNHLKILWKYFGSPVEIL